MMTFLTPLIFFPFLIQISGYLAKIIKPEIFGQVSAATYRVIWLGGQLRIQSDDHWM